MTDRLERIARDRAIITVRAREMLRYEQENTPHLYVGKWVVHAGTPPNPEVVDGLMRLTGYFGPGYLNQIEAEIDAFAAG